ncbi:MAG: CDP-alcohol phosphatidyltransferase family protein [Eubacteriales bacterium]|nr:CDP-alcohol phosphatidyltransferase family protein [Eubacteriales bacterium]
MNLICKNPESRVITIPNILSFFRICLIPVIVWLYIVKENSIWAGYLLILSGVTDIIDGFIARNFHMISNLGKVLDPIADGSLRKPLANYDKK